MRAARHLHGHGHATRTTALLALVLVAATFTACWRVTVPIGQTRYALDPARPQRCLLLMLPGFGDSAKRFADEGFVRAVRRAGVAADVIALDAHFGYYRSGALMERLLHDVLLPARRRGYRAVWVLGISMGGSGAFSAAGTYPDRIAGAILLAPYLGSSALIDEIARAGGPRRWQPGAAFEPDRFVGPARGGGGRAAHFRRVWSWVRTRRRSDGSAVPLYVGVGSDDDLRGGVHLLASALPPGHLFVQPGGHDWDVWRALFKQMLGVGFLQRACSR